MDGLPTISRRCDVIGAYKERGGSVAAVLPIHYPRGLLRAFDILPVEVWGPPGIDTRHGAQHVQSHVCSIVHNALSFLKSGGLDVADVLVVPHTCDSLQGLGSMLIDFISPRQPVLPIYLPRGQRESDFDFLADELRAASRRLETITGHSPSETDLSTSIRREEAADGLLSQLYRHRRALNIPDIAFYRLVRSREFLPAEAFSELARDMLSHLHSGNRSAPSGSDRVPILLSGIVPEPMSIFEVINDMGGIVVADDLACCGRRLYPAGESEEPFRRMAERILNGPPDPTRGSPIKDRLDHLLRLVDESGAAGVVFCTVKFCEPELFDLPKLHQVLQQAGIPSLTVETDLAEPLPHRIRTRLEAFLEMMRCICPEHSAIIGTSMFSAGRAYACAGGRPNTGPREVPIGRARSLPLHSSSRRGPKS